MCWSFLQCNDIEDVWYEMNRIILPASRLLSFTIKRQNEVFCPVFPCSWWDVTDTDIHITRLYQPSLKSLNSFLLGLDLSPNSRLWPMRLGMTVATALPRGSPEKDSVEITATHSAGCLQILNKDLLKELGNSSQVNTEFAFLVYPNHKTSKFLKYKESPNTEK